MMVLTEGILNGGEDWGGDESWLITMVGGNKTCGSSRAQHW